MMLRHLSLKQVGTVLSLKTAVETYAGTLTASERRLVEALLSSPSEAALLSAADLAARAGTHQATAVRLAQKLGYRGYPELRARLQADLLRPAPAARLQRRLERSEPGVLAALVAAEIEALGALPAHVSQGELDEAAATLRGAERVFLFAQGNARVLAELLERRLRRSGLRTVGLSGSGRDLAEQLVTLSAEDAVLAFAFHREPPGLSELLEVAQGVGARTLLISDPFGSTVRPRPERVLAAPRGEPGTFQTLAVPMAICNALVLTLAHNDDGHSVAALERLAGLLERFDPSPRTP